MFALGTAAAKMVVIQITTGLFQLYLHLACLFSQPVRPPSPAGTRLFTSTSLHQKIIIWRHICRSAVKHLEPSGPPQTTDALWEAGWWRETTARCSGALWDVEQRKGYRGHRPNCHFLAGGPLQPIRTQQRCADDLVWSSLQETGPDRPTWWMW